MKSVKTKTIKILKSFTWYPHTFNEKSYKDKKTFAYLGKGLARQDIVNKADGYFPCNDDFILDVKHLTLLPFDIRQKHIHL